MEQTAAAKSNQVLQERIRLGVSVGGRGRGGPVKLHTSRGTRMAAKAEKRAAQAAANEAYVTGNTRRAKRAAGGGSRRQGAVEAQWGNKSGQYKE